MTNPTPTICRIVRYRLTEHDAEQINRRRAHARAQMQTHVANQSGVMVHVGANVKEGDECPMIIVRVWGSTPESAVNGQVFLDGNDLFWATSVMAGEGPGTFSWPGNRYEEGARAASHGTPRADEGTTTEPPPAK